MANVHDAAAGFQFDRRQDNLVNGEHAQHAHHTFKAVSRWSGIRIPPQLLQQSSWTADSCRGVKFGHGLAPAQQICTEFKTEHPLPDGCPGLRSVGLAALAVVALCWWCRQL